MTDNLPLARESAFQILYKVFSDKSYSNIALGNKLKEQKMSNEDKAFCTELVYGVLRYKLSIEYIISIFSSVKLKKLSTSVYIILLISIYQIIYLDNIPESAAVNEAVKLAAKHAGVSKAFVNGVLRTVCREKTNFSYPDREQDIILHLSYKYSNPPIITKYYIKQYGIEFTEGLLKANLCIPMVCIRINEAVTDKKSLVTEFEKQGMEISEGFHYGNVLYLKKTGDIEKNIYFQKGFFNIQDESSMTAVKVLAPEKNDIVFDLCAAPGGKTVFISQLMENTGKIYAGDIHEQKLGLIQKALTKNNITNVELLAGDANKLAENYKNIADKVLLDAPCSGLGIVRKKPEIKWEFEKRTENYEKIQRDLIQSQSIMVKNGGILVYSTCTTRREENMYIVNWFLQNNKNFYLTDFEDNLPETLKNKTAKNGYIELYPHIDNTDGFFIAKMTRRD